MQADNFQGVLIINPTHVGKADERDQAQPFKEALGSEDRRNASCGSTIGAAAPEEDGIAEEERAQGQQCGGNPTSTDLTASPAGGTEGDVEVGDAAAQSSTSTLHFGTQRGQSENPYVGFFDSAGEEE